MNIKKVLSVLCLNALLCCANMLPQAEASCDVYVGKNNIGQWTHYLRVFPSSYGDIVDVEVFADPTDQYAAHLMASGMMQWDNILVKNAVKIIGMGAEKEEFTNVHYQCNWDEAHQRMQLTTSKEHPGGGRFLKPSIQNRYEYWQNTEDFASAGAAQVLMEYHNPEGIKGQYTYVTELDNPKAQYPDLDITVPVYVFTANEAGDAGNVYYVDKLLHTIWIQKPNGDNYPIYFEGASG